MKKAIFSIILLASICRCPAENTSRQVDSLKMVLKTAPNDSLKVKSLNELSAYLVDMDSYSEAMVVVNEALVLSERLNYERGVASSFRHIGIISTQQGNYVKALDDLFKSLKMQDKLTLKEKILLFNNIGIIYYYQKDYSTALEYFFKVSSIQGNNALTNENIGMVYFGDNQLDLALKYFNRALISYSLAGDKNSIGRIFNNVGSINEQQGNADLALNYYLKSLKIKTEIDDKQGIADATGSLADLYYRQGKFQQSINYELKSLSVAKEVGYMVSIVQTEEMLSNIYSKIGNSDLALFHYKRSVVLKDSLNNRETTKNTVRIEESYKYEVQKSIEKAEQDKKDAITFQQKRIQRIIIYSVSIGLFLVMLLAIFIFRGYRQKQRANIIISKQKKIVDEQHKDITDSIHYAKRIQTAALPPDSLVKEILPEHILFFEPKSIVSGDFYFVGKKDDKILWATCDATGHGPGASLVSVLGLNILSGIVNDGETIPSKILDKLNKSINESLHKTGDDSIRDGMDVTFCSLDKNAMMLNFAGANNGLWLIRQGTITEYKADKMAIGQMYKTSSYTNNEIQLQSGDCIYSFSDGICDLHSEDNKKFMKKRLRELLLSVQDKPMLEQKAIISETLKKWQGKAEQVDDMLIIGIRI